MSRILVVEDHLDINTTLSTALNKAGYETNSAYTGTEAMEKLKQTLYDLVLLDIMLPFRSGDEILKELRSFSDCPVLIISAKDLTSIKVDMLRIGADDYITKPFDLDEVLARIESNLRRSKMQKGQNVSVRYKDIILDSQAKRIVVNSEELDVTLKEYLIMELLLMNPNKVFTKANLYETIWGEEYLGDDNAVKTHISNLRSKLKRINQNDEYIETVWGLGYRLYKDSPK